MIDIFTNKIQFTRAAMEYDMMYEILMDSAINSETYIKFKFIDGLRGSVRKKDIIGFTDSYEGVEV